MSEVGQQSRTNRLRGTIFDGRVVLFEFDQY